MSKEVSLTIQSEAAMRQLGQQLGGFLAGGEVIELIGDVGAGKTTFTKGLALGMNITEPVQSPTFNISRVYNTRHGLRLAHYDFYRLNEAGIMSDELHETMHEPTTVTVVEWGGIVNGVLPEDRLQVHLAATSETERSCRLVATGVRSGKILEEYQQ